MATQATVTFRALNSDAPFPERTLTLHPHRRTIQIGRASKSPNKGLKAAVDNAWFDSPVMSRDHAEISLNAESNIITIRDIGSMHGTFVNGLQLRRSEPSGLSSGDLVLFGADVKRNLDTFPACAFKVNYEFLPFKASNSYAFPESDDEDYEISDDDDLENEVPSSGDGVSIESPPQKASQAIHAIDLTRDDSPTTSSFGQVGSSSQTRIEKDLMSITAARPADIKHHADPVSVAVHALNSPILVDSEDDDADFSSDSDDQSDEVEHDDGSSIEGNSVGEQEDFEGEGVRGCQVDRKDRSTSDLGDFPNKESGQASGLASVGLYSFLDAPLPDSNARTIIDASENIVEENERDDESDFGLSDAGAEGIRALFDDGLVDHEGDSYLDKSMEDERDSNNLIAYEAPAKAPTIEEKFEIPKHVTFASLPAEQHAEIVSRNAYFDLYSRPSGRLDIVSHPNTNARQSSPSDAAMVKTAIPSTTILNKTANPIQVHHLPIQEFQNLRAQSLGDKTGKHAFFAAREDNKAKLNATENSQSEPSPWFQQPEMVVCPATEEKRQRSTIAMGRFKEMRRRMQEETKKTMSEPTKTGLPVPIPSKASTSANFCDWSPFEGDRIVLNSPVIPPLPNISFLNDHSQAPKTIRTLSPEPDMTSAVTYNESKAFLANMNTSGRSGFRIHDIIEGAADHNSNSLKRKADEISDAIENEVRVWASSSPALEITSGLSTLTSQAAIPEVQLKTTSIVDTPEQRPTKRLRKIVESVGYVALGGATIFGALVLSAPDFL